MVLSCGLKKSKHPLKISLSEGDTPGASLQGRNPTTRTTDDLRFWLKCRDDPAKGLKTKAQLAKRQVILSMYFSVVVISLVELNKKGFLLLYLVKRIRY